MKKKEAPVAPIKKKRMRWYSIFLGTAVGMLILGAILLGISTYRLFTFLSLTPSFLQSLMFHPEVKETDGRTNMLLLGVGGIGHEGNDLTDTMMIVSLPISGSSIALLSLPRDIWSDGLQDKINSAYHYGNEQKVGGMVLAKKIVEEITGVPIHGVVVVDFSLFEKLIDLVGGVDISIPQGFTDSEFPIPGKENDQCNGDLEYRCRYTTVTFQKGGEHMDGNRALTYVRSRHAEGEEGTDFARVRRQQEVISSLFVKFKGVQKWLTPEFIDQILPLLASQVKTDMTKNAVWSLGIRLAQKRQLQFRHIDMSGELVNPSPSWYGGRYVLLPKNSWVELKNSIQASMSSQVHQ